MTRLSASTAAYICCIFVRAWLVSLIMCHGTVFCFGSCCGQHVFLPSGAHATITFSLHRRRVKCMLYDISRSNGTVHSLSTFVRAAAWCHCVSLDYRTWKKHYTDTSANKTHYLSGIVGWIQAGYCFNICPIRWHTVPLETIAKSDDFLCASRNVTQMSRKGHKSVKCRYCFSCSSFSLLRTSRLFSICMTPSRPVACDALSETFVKLDRQGLLPQPVV